ncbi:MAG: nitroreductase/quinone reductase family protein [Polyangiales bacterium]
MTVDRAVSRANGAVVRVLRSPFHWVLSLGLMLITVTGRRSGRVYTIPVGYQQDGSVITVLASEARTKQWWRNFETPAAVTLRLRGKEREGVATLVPPNSPEFRIQSEQTLTRLPFMGRVFGIRYQRRQGLTDAQLEALRNNIAIVQIQVAP